MTEEYNACVAGVKQTRKAILHGGAARVLLARNADPELTEPLEALCAERDVPVRWLPTMKEVGRVCRLDVGAAAAAALR